jgi:hypothetical protein
MKGWKLYVINCELLLYNKFRDATAGIPELLSGQDQLFFSPFYLFSIAA